MRLTDRAWRRAAAALSVALLLVAQLGAAQATPPQAVGDFKISLPLMIQLYAPLRIDSAASAAYTDTSGNLWQADTGFIGGIAGNHGNISIANTSDPRIYQTERYKLTG